MTEFPYLFSMATKVVPVPTGGCSWVMYNLGNYNYQCITVEEYESRLSERFWFDMAIIILFAFTFVLVIVLYATAVTKIWK